MCVPSKSCPYILPYSRTCLLALNVSCLTPPSPALHPKSKPNSSVTPSSSSPARTTPSSSALSPIRAPPSLPPLRARLRGSSLRARPRRSGSKGGSARSGLRITRCVPRTSSGGSAAEADAVRWDRERTAGRTGEGRRILSSRTWARFEHSASTHTGLCVP